MADPEERANSQRENSPRDATDELATGPMEAEAVEYLQKHKIPKLLENLTAALVFHRPEDPRAFTKDYVQDLLKAKTDPTQSPPVFVDDSNVQSVFGMLDLASNGSITREQYFEAMKSLGVSNFSRDPSGAEIDKISRDTFVLEAKAALKDAATTFLEI